MASLALPARPGLLAELFARQHSLALYGLVLLGLAAASVALQTLDPRLLDSGVNIWVKPAKFFFSIGVYALTAAWFFGYVRPERRHSPLMRAVVALILAAGSFELVYIAWQATQAQESHFNTSTPFHVLMYALMGIGAVLLVFSSALMAWEIGRRPAAGLRADFVAAVVIGLALTFLLGGGLGGYMSSQHGHAVGAEGGRLFFFGWNRSGGDLRIAHFLGIHAQQAIPILGALVGGLAARTRWALLIAGSTAYAALTLALFAQAIAGRALWLPF
jgi:hypothetical protein